MYAVENSDIDCEFKSKIIDCEDIEKIIISFNIYSSVRLYIEKSLDLDVITNILNSDKKQIFYDIEFSIKDVDYFIDIMYKDKVISIKVLSNNDIYYIIDDTAYSCSIANHLLLSNFVIQEYREEYPNIDLPYIRKEFE